MLNTDRPPSALALGILGLVVLLAPAAPVGADGERDLTKISLEELAQTKVISVAKKEEPRFRTPAAVHVITAEDIRRSGATSLAEALRHAPGVHVARINSSQWAIGMRGFTSRLSRGQLALMDGRSLYTPLFAGTYWEVQDTPLEDVERIEVVRGPGGTLWGANAVNGIVNIITKDAKDTQGWLLSAGGGTEERAFVRARYGGKIAEKAHYRLYGKYFQRDAAFHTTTGAFDDWHLAQGGFRTDLSLAANDRLTVQGDAYSGRAGQRTTASYYTAPSSRVVESEAELSGGNLNATWDHFREGSTLTVRTYYDRTNHAEAIFREARDTFDVELQHQFGLGERQEVVWGLAYRLSSGRTHGIETVVFTPADRTDHIFSAFIQDEIDLATDRLRLRLGTKLERNRYSGFEFQPSGRVVFTPHPRHALWAAVTRAVRTPSRLERDLSLTVSLSAAAPLFARVIGDEGFTSESMLAYEAGYRVQPGDRLSVETAVFHNRYGNLLSLETGPPFPEPGRQIVPFRFANLVRGRTSGVELASRLHLSKSWLIGASYSYLSMDLEPEPGSTDTTSEGAEGDSPRHAARIQASGSLLRDLDLYIGFRWVDELPGDDVPAYSALDARVGWFVVPSLELAVVGQNLLDAHHAEFGSPANRAEIQRSVYGEVRWRW